jgi:hypothetical protein
MLYMYHHIFCLLTNDNNTPNHNMTIYCVSWQTTTKINPTIIWLHILFTDEWQQYTQSLHYHILCLLADENNDKQNHNTTTYCVYWMTTTYDKPNNNTTTYCVCWQMTTTTNPTIIRPHIVFTDGRQQHQT